MEIEIVENKKQSLYVYKADELLYYSTIKFNWLNKNLIKIFNSNNDLVLEIQRHTGPFRSTTYKILFQNIKIKDVTDDSLSFDEDKILKNIKNDFLSFNQNSIYLCNEIKVAEIKQKLWNSPQKIILNVDEKFLDFLNFIIIHVLLTKTGHNSD